MVMESLSSLHHRHQPLSSSLYPSLTSAATSSSSSSSSSFFLSQTPSSSSSSSSSIRASSYSSPPPPPSSDPLQNLQYQEPKTLLSHPPLQHPELKSPQFSNPIPKFPSFSTITVAAAAAAAAASSFLFLGYCRNGFNKPIPFLSPEETTLDENSDIGEFLGSKPDHVHSILYLRLKERVPVVHSFKKTKTDYEEAWKVLEGQVFSCSENLELARVGFEEILEKDMDCNKAHHDKILEYLEMVDECNGLLKGIRVAMKRCEKENADDMKRCLRFFGNVVSRIRVIEGLMLDALKTFKEPKTPSSGI